MPDIDKDLKEEVQIQSKILADHIVSFDLASLYPTVMKSLDLDLPEVIFEIIENK